MKISPFSAHIQHQPRIHRDRSQLSIDDKDELFEENTMNHSDSKQRVVFVLNTGIVVEFIVPQTPTGHFQSLLRALSDDHIADYLIARKVHISDPIPNHLGNITALFSGSLIVIRHRGQMFLEEIHDGVPNFPWHKRCVFVGGHFVRVFHADFGFVGDTALFLGKVQQSLGQAPPGKGRGPRQLHDGLSATHPPGGLHRLFPGRELAITPRRVRGIICNNDRNGLLSLLI